MSEPSKKRRRTTRQSEANSQVINEDDNNFEVSNGGDTNTEVMNENETLNDNESNEMETNENSDEIVNLSEIGYVNDDQSDLDVSDTELEEENGEINILKIDDIDRLNCQTVKKKIQGRLVKATRPKYVKGIQELTKNKSFWQIIILLSNENLDKTIKITIWGPKMYEFLNLKPKYYDLITLDGILTKDESQFNWATCKFVLNVGDRQNSGVIKKETIHFEYNKLIFTKLNELEQGQINIKAKVISIKTDQHPKIVKIKTKQGFKVISFFRDETNGQEIEEINVLKVKENYAFIGLYVSEDRDDATNHIINALPFIKIVKLVNN